MKDLHSNHFLHKALMYDQLASYFKYIDPTSHMLYYQKHFSYMQKFMNAYREEITENSLRVMMAKVRIFHAAIDTPTVDVFINDRKAFHNIQFKQMSDYLRLDPGDYKFSIFRSGETEAPLLRKSISIQPENTYTLAVSGTINNLDLIQVTDHKYVPVGETRLRFLHLSPDTPSIDIAEKNGDVIFSNIQFKQITKYLRLSPRTVDLEIRLAGTKEVVLFIPNVKLRQSRAITITAIGLSKGLPKLEAFILTP